MRNVLIVILFSVLVLGQAKSTKPDLKLTGDEKFQIERLNTNMQSAKSDVLEARLALRAAEDREELAKETFKSKVSAMLAKHNIDSKAYALCGGPSAGVCDGAPESDIILRKRENFTEKK